MYWLCDGCDGVMERRGRGRGYITPVFRRPSTGTDLQCKDFWDENLKYFLKALILNHFISADEDNFVGISKDLIFYKSN